ncbi:MAG: hypothetical protein Q7R95_01495, partial [bacterium]|nr:hypothetical protein [bacterium]
LAIWFIIAIVIVAVIMLLFVFQRKAVIEKKESFDVQSIIEKCARDSVNEAVDKMLPPGGFIEPTNYKIYKNIKITYLCQNVGYFKTCINQHPALLSEMREEILSYVNPRIDVCFSNMKIELEKQNSNVELGAMNISLSFGTDRIFLNIDRKVKITKYDETKISDRFKVEINNPIYDLEKVASEIANQEAKYCYFEYVGYMILYPRFSIDKTALSDSTKIYTIKDRYSNKEINIATRSCAIPPGL